MPVFVGVSPHLGQVRWSFGALVLFWVVPPAAVRRFVWVNGVVTGPTLRSGSEARSLATLSAIGATAADHLRVVGVS